MTRFAVDDQSKSSIKYFDMAWGTRLLKHCLKPLLLVLYYFRLRFGTPNGTMLRLFSFHFIMFCLCLCWCHCFLYCNRERCFAMRLLFRINTQSLSPVLYFCRLTFFILPFFFVLSFLLLFYFNHRILYTSLTVCECTILKRPRMYEKHVCVCVPLYDTIRCTILFIFFFF